MRTRLVLFVVAAFVVIANAGSSPAAPIAVGYSGVINTMDDPNGLLPGVVPGTTFSGTYTLDPDLFTAFSEPFPTLLPGFFIHILGPGSVEVDIGGNLFSRDVNEVFISDAVIAPEFGVLDSWSLGISSFSPTPAVALTFSDTTLTRITDPTSFFVNTSLDGWDISEMVLLVEDPSLGFRELTGGTITELFVIPEPSTALLVGLGLVTLGARRRA